MTQGMPVTKVAEKKPLSASPFITKITAPPVDIVQNPIDEAISPTTLIYPSISLETSKSMIHEFLIRTLDITGSVIMLALVIIPMAIVAILIKATSQGPVFFL